MNKDNRNSQDLLNEAIREASTGASPASPTAARPATHRTPTISEALREQQTSARVGAGGTASGIDGEITGEGTVANHQMGRQRLAGVVAGLVLLIAAGGYWWSQRRPTTPAPILNDLVAAVEQHRATHDGKLPASLAPMGAFPQGGVEWPLRYWKARDAAGRTEIIWVPRGEHYSIALRKGNATWVVSDREPKPKPILTKGNP